MDRRDFNSYEAYHIRSQCNLAQQHYDLAIRDASQAIALNRGVAVAFFTRGNAFATMGQQERAKMDFDEALRLDDRHAKAYYSRALLNLEQGQYQEAIQDFDKAHLTGFEDEGGIQLYRGRAQERNAHYLEAVRELTRAIEILDEPRLVDAYLCRSMAYRKLQRIPEELADLNAAIARLEILEEPRLVDAHMDRSMAYQKLGRIPEALADLDTAIARLETAIQSSAEPQNTELKMRLVSLKMDRRTLANPK